MVMSAFPSHFASTELEYVKYSLLPPEKMFFCLLKPLKLGFFSVISMI